MKNFIKLCALFLILFANFNIKCSIITTLSKNDPAPLFTTIFPYNYLSQNEKEYLKERVDFYCPQFFSFSISPFYQTASCGKNINAHKAQLGDLTGKWNMIAALPFNVAGQTDIPEGREPFPVLERLRDKLLECIDFAFRDTTGQRVPSELQTVPGLLSLQTPEELFGFFSVPIKYRKVGVRFEANARIYKDFGFSAQTGVADISQIARFIDQTATPTACAEREIERGVSTCISSCDGNTLPPLYCLNPFTTNRVNNDNWKQVVDCVHIELMNKLQNVINEIDMDLCNFNKTGIEDVHFEFWWRHLYNVKPNDSVECCWLPFLFVPFASIGASIATGERINVNNPLSLAFGNNGHHALRFNAGFSLDFFDTIEIGMHAGVVNFFKRKTKSGCIIRGNCDRDDDIGGLRVPTNNYQNVLIPYKTNVEIKPGQTWHIGLFMNAFHFIDCVSAYVEYLYVSHLKDKICVLGNNNNGAFKPKVLECVSPWNIHLLNGALNYDVSPNFTLGFAVQIPLTGRNIYKSTTYMLSTTLTF